MISIHNSTCVVPHGLLAITVRPKAKQISRNSHTAVLGSTKHYLNDSYIIFEDSYRIFVQNRMKIHQLVSKLLTGKNTYTNGGDKTISFSFVKIQGK
jgi:hypothetical protein